MQLFPCHRAFAQAMYCLGPGASPGSPPTPYLGHCIRHPDSGGRDVTLLPPSLEPPHPQAPSTWGLPQGSQTVYWPVLGPGLGASGGEEKGFPERRYTRMSVQDWRPHLLLQSV